MMFSAGWPGHLQRTLEALVGQGVTVLYFNGAEGDQAPVARPDSGSSHWERAERYGRELALKAWELWQEIRPRQTEQLHAHSEPIELPERTWHPDFLRTGGTEYGLTKESVKVLLQKLVPERTHSLSVQVGDLLIVGVPGEMASGLGLDIKLRLRQETGVPHVVIGGLADEWVSYILQPEEYRRGGYEASVSFYGPGLGAVIVSGVLRGVEGMK